MEFIGSKDIEDSQSEAESKLLSKLENHFLSEGLSMFSSRASVAFFQVS